MKTGSIEGKINGLFQVIYDSGELTEAATTITVSNLTGDNTTEYVAIIRQVSNASGASGVYIRPNNDSGATNYGYQNVSGASTTEAAARDTTYNQIAGSFCDATDILSLAVVRMNTQSEKPRIAQTARVRSVSYYIHSVYDISTVWNNTADEITSMVFTSSADGLGIGSRIILLEKTEIDAMKTGDIEPQGTIEGAWELIAETEVSEATTAVTFSGLTGNTDVLYKIVAVTNNYATGAANVKMQLNADADTNYFDQYMKGEDAVDEAARTANSTHIALVADSEAADDYNFASIILYAKSGYKRVAYYDAVRSINAKDVDELTLVGGAWSNTADEITSIVFQGSETECIDAGSHYELWRLNL